MKIPCPYCGRDAEQTDQHNHAQSNIELQFQCASASCRKHFAGALKLEAMDGFPAFPDLQPGEPLSPAAAHRARAEAARLMAPTKDYFRRLEG